MAARTYQPSLRRLLRAISVFVARYREQLEAGMSPDAAAALALLVTAMDGMITELAPPGGV